MKTEQYVPHSGLILFGWALFAFLVQRFDGLLLGASALLLTGISITLAPARSIRMLRRSRFIFIALVVIYACTTPGERVLLEFSRPTREGIALAILHASRLAAVLALVTLLLERVSLARIVTGLQVLCGPLVIVGIQPERAAVRLTLIMTAVEAGGRHTWRSWLRGEGQDGFPPRVLLPDEHWRGVDSLVLLVLSTVVSVLLWEL